MLLKVKLTDPALPGNGGTVVDHPASVQDYLASVTDRDGTRDTRFRLWQGDAPVGALVHPQED